MPGTGWAELLAFRRAAIVSTQFRPWFTAFLIRANPPSSPTTKRLGTEVSYSEVRYGISAAMLGLAVTIVIAPTGHASAHKPWPMHLCPLTITAFPPIIASTSPSGQTLVQVPQPMQ